MDALQITAFSLIVIILGSLYAATVRGEGRACKGSKGNGHEYRMPDGTWVEVDK